MNYYIINVYNVLIPNFFIKTTYLKDSINTIPIPRYRNVLSILFISNCNFKMCNYLYISTKLFKSDIYLQEHILYIYKTNIHNYEIKLKI